MLTQNGAGTVCMYVFLYNGGGTVMYVFMYVYTFGTWKINGGGVHTRLEQNKRTAYVCMYVYNHVYKCSDISYHGPHFTIGRG